MLFTRYIKIFFLLSFVCINNIFSIAFLKRFKDDAFNKFKSGITSSLLASVQTGGFFRNQDGFTPDDYKQTIKDGIDLYFENAGEGFFSRLRSDFFDYDNTVPDGIIKSILSGNTKTQRSLRSFFKTKEIKKQVTESIVKKIKNIKTMTWGQRFKNGAKWGAAYSVVGAGFYLSLDAYKDYIEYHNPIALKWSYRVLIPSITASYLLAKHGLKKGFKRTVIVNSSILAASIILPVVLRGLKAGFDVYLWG